MLRGFLAENFDELVSRTKAKAAARRSSPKTTREPEPEVQLLLAQLGAALRSEQLVQGHGDLREVIGELAAEQGRTLAPAELAAVGRGLDGVIADAVAAHAREKEAATAHREVERLGQVGHDLRNQLQTALLSFRALRTGRADIGAAAGDALGRSLARLGELVETRLSAVGLAAVSRVSLAAFAHEVAVAARAEAARRGIRLTVEPGDAALAVDVDPQLLASALMSLLQNAFENTRAHGSVTLRARGERGRAFVEVEDECGGMGTGRGDPRGAAGERRATARVAPGHGLSSSRRAAQANGGEVHIHDLPGKGCIFGIELPLAAPVDAGP